MEERQLLAELQNASPKAIEHFVFNYQNKVYNTILGMVQSRPDAEELTQDVFVKAMQGIQGFKGDARISTWLYRIAINIALDFIKKRTRKKRFAFIVSIWGKEDGQAIDLPHFVHPGIQLQNKEAAAQLFKAINTLPAKQKTALVLHKIEGLSYEQAAQVMDTTVSSVESLLFRARQNLKKMLAHYFENEL